MVIDGKSGRSHLSFGYGLDAFFAGVFNQVWIITDFFFLRLCSRTNVQGQCKQQKFQQIFHIPIKVGLPYGSPIRLTG
jgi:hypothetical protein